MDMEKSLISQIFVVRISLKDEITGNSLIYERHCKSFDLLDIDEYLANYLPSRTILNKYMNVQS